MLWLLVVNKPEPVSIALPWVTFRDWTPNLPILKKRCPRCRSKLGTDESKVQNQKAVFLWKYRPSGQFLPETWWLRPWLRPSSPVSTSIYGAWWAFKTSRSNAVTRPATHDDGQGNFVPGLRLDLRMKESPDYLWVLVRFANIGL